MEWADVVAMGAELPEVTESTSYRTPCLKVRDRTFCRLRVEAEGGLVVFCSLDEKQALLACGGAFFTTPHYDGHGSILVDLARVDPGELRELLTESWRAKAPARLRASFDANP